MFSGADLPPANGRLEGKVAVISGVARGIGRSIAATFVTEGASVIGLDLDEPPPPPAGPALAAVHVMDVTDEQAWERLAAHLDSTPPHILVNNAGGLLDSSILHEHSATTWQQTLDLNLTSVFYSMRAFIPPMIRRGGGSIINIGSVSGQRGQGDAPAYQAAKAGVTMLSRNAAVTYGRFGIRVNTVTPSVVATEGLARESDERTAGFLARVPLGRAGLPREVAVAVTFLASDESSFITGADLAVDGGYLT